MYGHPMTPAMGWASLQRAERARIRRQRLALLLVSTAVATGFLVAMGMLP